MKRREGFVSNSSSSSFIVVANSEEDIKKLKLTVKFDLTTFLDSYKGILRTKEEVIEYLKEQCMYYDEEVCDDSKKMIDAVDNGKLVFIGSFSDDNYNSDIENYLCNHGLYDVKMPKGAEIIQGEGGY